MGRACRALAFIPAAAVALSCSSSTPTGPGDNPAERAPGPKIAAGLQRFGVDLQLANREAFFADGRGFGVRVAAAKGRPLEVRLPPRAASAFTIADDSSGASIAVKLLDTRLGGAHGVLSDGAVIYEARDATVVFAARRSGVEDHVLIRRGDAIVRYHMALGPTIAGLRKVGERVELLDAGGAPRLRIGAPFVADARGNRYAVNVAIEGCLFDTDPQAPWGRPVVAPGARSCTLRLSWDGARVGLPALLDPTWTLTGDMAYPRARFALTTLSTGKVLAAAGAFTKDTELYDPSTGTWALTGALSSTFSYTTHTPLSDGRVLLVSGKKSATYSPATGTWTDTGALTVDRFRHAAARLSSGKVLVSGGAQSTAPYATTKAEIFDPATGTWSATADMLTARERLALSALPNGRALAVNAQTAEVFDEGTSTWSATAAPPSAHYSPLAAPLANGRVMILGKTAAVSIFDSSTGTWTAAPPTTFEHWDGSAVTMANGSVLVTGGWDDNIGGEVEDAERWVPALNQWLPSGTLQYLRFFHGSALLPGGDVIVAGGDSVIIDDQDTVERLALGKDGAACQAAGDCDSAYCVGGVCCNEACAGKCRTCRANEKTSGADGVCGFVKAGSDPANQCADQGAASCGTDGACDGAGACSKYPSGTACASPQCQNGSLQTSTCSAASVCVQSSVSCAPYACADGISCAAACTLDAQCLAPATCDLGTGKCVPPQANGATCSNTKQCASGFCVDGVCCDAVCTGTCQACSAQKKGGGTDGSCGNVAAGLDPNGDCPTDAPASCQRDGACDGAGACRLYTSGTPCGPTTCVGNQQTGSSCDGAGTCSSGSTTNCGEYACAGTTCNTSCTVSSDCAAKAWCENGSCKPRLATGTSCVSSEQCESGFCVDGVCCQAPCVGQCAACDTAGALGLCVPIKGAPRGGRPPCAPAAGGETCSARACDGIERSTCNGFVGAEVECRAASCDEGVATLAAQCDGFGTCPAEQSTPCAPYACTAGVCQATCASDADCAAGATCNATTGQCVAGAVCTGPFTLKNAAGTIQDCSPYACSVAACRDSCSSIQDCAPGFVCSGSGKCAAKPSAAGDEGGCSITRAKREWPRGILALWLLALGAVVRRRRNVRA